jgi:glyoxylase-like metal-dependent hydrolase (beta-lactamase superfamily II)
MNLEDHVGDIISKARRAVDIPVAEGARAAGLSDTQLADLEESGQTPGSINWEALARVLVLDAQKLRGIAEGWSPQETDLSRWRQLRRITTDDGGMAVNCFLIWDEATREAALFDTGWNATPILKLIQENQLQLRHLFITHTHRDHVAALTPIRESVSGVKLHSSSQHAPTDQRNRPDDLVQLGSLRIRNRDTPGHAEDGVTYVIENWPENAPSVAIVGDAIFSGSMGGALGDAAKLARQKVRDQILSLPRDTLLCPGHGPLTTVAAELTHNPFFP